MTTNITYKHSEQQIQHFVDLLSYRAQQQADKVAYIFLQDGEIESSRLTFAELDQRARAIATTLQKTCVAGQRALLLYPSGLEFIAAFFGCLYAGIVAIPAYPPRRNRPDERIQAIVKDAQPTVVLSSTEVMNNMTDLATHTTELKGLHWLATNNIDKDLAQHWQSLVMDSDSLAFLQYTSGSTGNPKGVMISHGNLLHNQRLIELAFVHSSQTTYVSWLPMFHDMGLIGNVLQSLYLGKTCILMSPTAFLQKPLRWLQAITRYRATTSGGPNFAYDLCVRKTTVEQRASLDLSSWDLAFNGAEPVRSDTLERFSLAFKSSGFRRQALYPCYGMAESTLFVSGGSKLAVPRIRSFERAALKQSQAENVAGSVSNSFAYVGCGRPWLDDKIVIAQPDSLSRCTDGRIGEIWVSSPSVAQGYWNQAEHTKKTFAAYLSDSGEGPFLRTGDLGFLQDGELFVTGRLKDLIIIRGQNYYPQDIEASLERCNSVLQPGAGAAFPVQYDTQEQLVVVHEVKSAYRHKLDVAAVVKDIRQVISEQHGLQPYAIALLKPGSIAKTSSGKIRRHACRAGFLGATLKLLGEWRFSAVDKPTPVLASATQSQNRQSIETWLVATLAQQLQLAAQEINIQQPFSSYGLDSVTAVSLSGELAAWLQRELPATLVYDYPNIESLARYLAEKPTTTTTSLQSDTPLKLQSEAIAIIGMACRFPGAHNLEAFWQLLQQGIDAISEVPATRWQTNIFNDPTLSAAVKMSSRIGGFIDQIDQFDPQFFGISPREARRMDPQQRLLLEVSWQALENAALAASQLAGSQTGVFIGISNNDYLRLQFANTAELDIYTGTGGAFSIAANRLSYLLDLRGPSWAVDTACSSSLVAIHQACQSLRHGECNLAFAGGVNLLVAPELSLAFSQAQMLASDGRCKTFDADADGYVRGEGCGVMVLKPLSAALKDNDNILALIKGSAINQDGRSNGLTAPNGLAQQAVIKQALKNADVDASHISYVEAHGTGTPLGDPIEVNSLAEILSVDGGSQQPCCLGSVKSNIGHLEAAAGIASLIKVVLAMQHQEIPPQLHFKTLNPHISIADSRLFIPTECQKWPQETAQRLAGVSSFGFGGTNAHVIVQQAPAATPVSVEMDRSTHLLTLSTKSANAMSELVDAYDTYLESHSELSLADFCFTANTGRSHFNHRLAIVADSKTQLQQRLRAVSGVKHRSKLKPKIAFLFTGQGSQYVDMGRQLYETQPSFRRTIDQCDEILSCYLAKPLREVLYPQAGSASPLNETAYAQPALFALQYALAELWQSWGIVPDAVMGHSVGQYAAACVAGVFSLQQGLRLIAERSRLMQALAKDGEMLAVFTTEAEINAVIRSHAVDVSIAAFNGPKSLVISGLREQVRVVNETLNAQGVETKTLKVSHAFHSPLIEPMLDAFERVAKQINFKLPRIPLICGMTGQLVSQQPLFNANYWRRHTRQPVQFVKAMNTLLDDGFNVLLEIGAKPVLLNLGKSCRQETTALWLASLQQGRDNWSVILNSLSRLYTLGLDINWSGFDQHYTRQRLSLPTYPFQRKRYWISHGDPSMDKVIADETQQELPLAKATSTKYSRHIRIQTKLHSVVADVLQASTTEVDVFAPLLEMGADSLLLMEAVRVIEKTFGIKIAIRQLFEELTTIDAVAIYIDENISLDSEWSAADSSLLQDHSDQQELVDAATSNVLPVSTAVSPATSTSTSDTVVQRIVAQQLQLMSQQLDVLRANTSSADDATLLDGIQCDSDAHSATQTEQKNLATAPAFVNVIKLEPHKAATKLASALPPWRITNHHSQHLSTQQRRYLENFITRYTLRTQKSKQLAQRYRPVLADNRASAGFRFSTKELLYPIVGEKSQGAKFWDIDGNEYLDISMGFGVNLFGHHPDFISQALEIQLKQGMSLGPQTAIAGEVAQLICDLTGMQRVCFCNSGTEAVMTALRLARTATGRNKIAMFAGSYHGHFDGTLASATADNTSIPVAPGISSNMVSDVLVLNYADPHAFELLQQYGQQLAAVLVEPVQSRQPDLQPVDFLKSLRQWTQQAGVALIFDEMITGFRVHPGGAQASFGIEADIATYGKIVGGGMPIGVVAGSASYMDGIDGGVWQYGDKSYPQAETTFFAGTFCKHPLTMAASRAVLSHIKQQGCELQAQLNLRTTQLAETLNVYFVAHEIPIHITHFASLFRFTVSRNLDLFFYHLLHKGIYIWEGRNCFLSTAHSESDIDFLIAKVKESVEDLISAGFIAQRSVKSKSSSSSIEQLDTATVSREKISDQVPLSEAQKQLWALANMSPEGSLAYHLSISLQLRGCLNVTALRQAVQCLVDRHEALRTTIDESGELQYILSNKKIHIPVIDFSNTEPNSRTTKVTEWFQQENRTAFSFSQDSLFRARILRLEKNLHVLFVTSHHIISDGWSINVLLQEITALYAAKCGGDSCVLQPPMQFRQYLQWQQNHNQAMSTHENYWLNQFADSVPVLDLPTDRPRSAFKTYHSNRLSVTISADITTKLKKFGNKNNCTLFMLLLSIYTLLLHRFTSQNDIIVGVPAAGRSLKSSEGMVGYCAHLLAIRSCMDDSATFEQHLQQLKKVLLDAYDHQDYPFAQLVNALKIPVDASRSPLVTTTFNLDRFNQVPQLHELETQLYSQPIGFAGYDLNFNIIDFGKDLLLQCDYNTELFDDDTIQRLLGYFNVLLEAVLSHPGQSVCKLQLLDQPQRQQLLVEWNDTATDLPSNSCIHNLIKAQAKRSPKRIAFICENTQLSYQQLEYKANQLACMLIDKGVAKNDYIAIVMERGLEVPIALLAVMKAGAAFVPLDPNWPQQRMNTILDELDSNIVLVDKAMSEWQSPARTIIVVEQSCLAGTSKAPRRQRQLDDPIYVIFTSGSTGIPKGAVNLHRGIHNRFAYMSKVYGERKDDVILQNTPHTFDSAVWQLFWPLTYGARVVIPARGNGVLLPQKLIELIAREKVTISDFVPSVLDTFVACLAEQAALTQKIGTLRQLLIGGEAIKPEAIQQLRNKLPNLGITNTYGPTETSIGVIFYEIPQHIDALIPIGKPIDNVSALVLDKFLNLSPIGVPGELYLAGACLGAGYLNNQAATDSVFIDNPFNEINSHRLYKTGDRVRYRADGNIEFLGRVDQQVKIRGLRIELGEIETAIRQHTAIQDAVVIARQDMPGNKRLVAYIVAKQHQAPDKNELRHFLTSRLPTYMLPASFMTLDALPLTRVGKLDCTLLPKPQDADLHANYVAPNTNTEQLLATIWEDILAVKQVGMHDNFFELGGDSILSIQVIAKARQAGLQLTPKQLFQYQSIAELATVAKHKSIVQAEQATVIGLISPTPIQQWFFEQALPEPHHFNQAVMLDVAADLNPQWAKQVTQQLLVQHDALRLRVQTDPGLGWQLLQADIDKQSVFSVVDLSASTTATQSAELTAIAAQQQASLDLQHGPILRVTLFTTGAQQPGQLLFVIHHLAVDGISWRILLEDWQRAYEQLSRGEIPILPAKTSAFKSWTERLNQFAQSDELAIQQDYWLALSQITATHLPRDFPPVPEVTQPGNTVASAARVCVSLSVTQTSALLEKVPQAYHTQINDILLTALTQCLTDWIGHSKIVIDLEGHGREDLFEDIDLSRTVGWFTTVYPVCLELATANKLPGAALKSIKEQLRQIPQHGIGYGLLRYLKQDPALRKSLSELPQAELSFNYLGQFDQIFNHSLWQGWSQQSIGSSYSPAGQRSHLIEIEGRVMEGCLQLDWLYSENCYYPATIEMLAQNFKQNLLKLITHCQSSTAGDYTPSDFPLAGLDNKSLEKLTHLLSTGKVT